MIIVKVTYTVKQEFVAENRDNISAFMKDFREMDNTGFRYNVYLCEDGKTFVHLSHYNYEDVQKQVLAVKSFLYFQQQRDNSGFEIEPKVEMMKLISSSRDIFK